MYLNLYETLRVVCNLCTGLFCDYYLTHEMCDLKVSFPYIMMASTYLECCINASIVSNVFSQCEVTIDLHA